MRTAAVLAVLALAYPADAATCHKFSIWHYPWPQTCATVHLVQREPSPSPPLPLPPVKPADADMPLPSLDFADPPDCAEEWCDRLRAIGKLREQLGTN